MLGEAAGGFAAAIKASDELPFQSITWHWALMRSPARVSWTTGVAHAA